MSKRNWGKRFAIGIGTLVLLALTSFAGNQLHQADRAQMMVELRAKHDADKQRQNAKAEKERGCSGLNAAALVDCEHEATNSLDNAERDIRDLEAQQTMALWTRYMGIAAIVGITISAIGVILVFTTFREARKTNDIARSGQRPWMQLHEHNFTPMGRMELNGAFHEKTQRIEMVFRNTGPVPARILTCCISHQTTDMPDPAPIFEQDVDNQAPFIIGPNYNMPITKIIPGHHTDDVRRERRTFWVYCYIHYEEIEPNGRTYETEVTIAVVSEGYIQFGEGRVAAASRTQIRGPQNRMT